MCWALCAVRAAAASQACSLFSGTSQSSGGDSCVVPNEHQTCGQSGRGKQSVLSRTNKRNESLCVFEGEVGVSQIRNWERPWQAEGTA